MNGKQVQALALSLLMTSVCFAGPEGDASKASTPAADSSKATATEQTGRIAGAWSAVSGQAQKHPYLAAILGAAALTAGVGVNQVRKARNARLAAEKAKKAQAIEAARQANRPWTTKVVDYIRGR